MCGIAGILDAPGRPADLATARRMTDRMAHRGPDGEGSFSDGSLALAHRRLAILDLTDAAHQPMTRAGYTLVYNGELYNFRALREELRSRGHAFVSGGDTEVVLAAFREWDLGCLERFDGMFAFAVWDAAARRLSLARDRFGIKPLYYARIGERFVFASEIKPLLDAGMGCEVDLDALQEYLTFQNTFSDRTLFAGVRCLPPGHRLTVEPGGPIRLSTWWAPAFDPEEGRTLEDWAGAVREELAASVRRELVADVPVGSYLSGGLDSASIVSLAAAERPGIPTFTGGFDMASVSGIEVVFDERPQASRVADHVGATPHVIEMREGDMARVLPNLVWHLEDLRVGTSWQNWYVADLAGRQVRVCLAGTGGDEVFAGYPWRFERSDELPPAEFEARSYLRWCRLLGDEARPGFFTAQAWARMDADRPREVFRDLIRQTEGCDPVARELGLEMRTFLHGLLVVQDRLAMAHSLEERVPFLDRALVDLASRIPSRFKLADGGGKRVLREAVRDLLPAGIADLPKQGFSPPEGSWYRGQSVRYVQEVLLSERALARGYFRPDAVRAVIAEHVEGRANHRLLIWSLLCFEHWNRSFVDGEVPE